MALIAIQAVVRTFQNEFDSSLINTCLDLTKPSGPIRPRAHKARDFTFESSSCFWHNATNSSRAIIASGRPIHPIVPVTVSQTDLHGSQSA